LIKYIFSWDDASTSPTQNIWLQVSMVDPINGQAVIEYSGGKENKIEGTWQVFSGEKIKVTTGVVSLTLADNASTIKINQLWEFRYDGDKNFTLFSSDAWIDSQSPINIDMRYGKVSSTSASVFALSQNEIASTLYVLKGSVWVENLAGKQATIAQWDKLTIMRDASNDDKADLALLKEPIDENIKSSDWFTQNQWATILSASLAALVPTSTWTWLWTATGMNLPVQTQTGTQLQNNGNGFNYVTITSHQDEGEVSTSPITIDGILNDTSVYRIEINGVAAEINATTMSFTAKGVQIDKKMNDVVYKVFDGSSKLLQKWVMTLYNNQWASTGKEETSLAQVKNYPINNSSVYKIISPKENPLTTTSNVVKLEGMVPSRTVKKIVINGFQLQKFPQNGTYWSYFANSDFGNLKEWVNIYKIEYYGADDTVVYENNFTIIKESDTPTPPPATENQ